MLALLFTSCEEDLNSIESSAIEVNTVYFNINSLSDGPVSTQGKRPHKLGPVREIPFAVAVLNKAHQTVHGTGGLYQKSAANYTTTDLYLKFSPTTAEQLEILDNSELFLLDYPFTQEVVEQGDFNETFSGDIAAYPELYTTVPFGTQLPDNIPYEIIERLNLVVEDPAVIEEAYRMTDNLDEYYDEYGQDAQPEDFDLENFEELSSPEYFGGNTDPDGPAPGPRTGTRSTSGGSGTSSTSRFTTNDCGCEIFTNQRRPGGTIKVFDTQFNAYQPVRRVEVTAKNGWFTRRRVSTDDNGCWKIDKEYKGKSWFYIKFKDKVSNRGKLRLAGVNGWRVWQKLSSARLDLGMKRGPNYHDIQVNIDAWDGGTTGTKSHYSWAAATVNNALHEYHDLARSEGFIAPPTNLNIMIPLNFGGGYAIMLRQMGANNFGTALAAGMGYRAANNTEISNSGVDLFFNLTTGSTNWTNSSLLLNTFLGDVNIGGKRRNSDQLKQLAYHELGHASHYQGVSVAWYRALIAAEVGANGHGDVNSIDAERIQIAESWAEHIGLTMVAETYRGAPEFAITSPFANNWTERLENIRHETENHIPTGIYNDLNDGINRNEAVIDGNGLRGRIDDNTQGYNNRILSSFMNRTVTSPANLRRACLNELPAGTSRQSVEALFDQY